MAGSADLTVDTLIAMHGLVKSYTDRVVANKATPDQVTQVKKNILLSMPTIQSIAVPESSWDSWVLTEEGKLAQGSAVTSISSSNSGADTGDYISTTYHTLVMTCSNQLPEIYTKAVGAKNIKMLVSEDIGVIDPKTATKFPVAVGSDDWNHAAALLFNIEYGDNNAQKLNTNISDLQKDLATLVKGTDSYKTISDDIALLQQRLSTAQTHNASHQDIGDKLFAFIADPNDDNKQGLQQSLWLISSLHGKHLSDVKAKLLQDYQLNPVEIDAVINIAKYAELLTQHPGLYKLNITDLNKIIGEVLFQSHIASKFAGLSPYFQNKLCQWLAEQKSSLGYYPKLTNLNLIDNTRYGLPLQLQVKNKIYDDRYNYYKQRMERVLVEDRTLLQ